MKILTISKKSGWITKIKYRESMNDLVITQSNKKQKVYRQLYVFGQDVVNKLTHFLNEIDRTTALKNMKKLRKKLAEGNK